MRPTPSSRRVAAAFACLALAASAEARAQPERAVPVPSGAAPVTLDRTLVRFVSAETGGSARPRFLSEREVGFFTRVEALIEQADLPEGLYPERYVRTAVDRLVARAMLSSLLVQRGVEPPDLARRAQEARADLEARVGGAAVLDALLASESLDNEELARFLRDQVRAAYYVDRAITPILAVTEDQLREAHRGASHPFRGSKLDDVRPRLRVWLVTERLRAAELEFLQSARGRVKIATNAPPSSEAPPPSPPTNPRP